jgi:hypothetical protein
MNQNVEPPNTFFPKEKNGCSMSMGQPPNIIFPKEKRLFEKH